MACVSFLKVRCLTDVVRVFRAEVVRETAFVEFGRFMKSDFPMETADLSALAQVRAVHAEFPAFGLAFKKTQLYDRLRRSRCPYNRLKRLVPDEFRRVRPKQHLRSLANRSGGKVVPPQLPSGRNFIFQSCPLPATCAGRVSHSRIALRYTKS